MGGGGNSTIIIKNLNLRSQDIKTGKTGLNQSLIPPSSLIFFYFALFNSVAKNKLFFFKKNIGGAFALLLPIRPASYAYGLRQCSSFYGTDHIGGTSMYIR